MPIKSLESYLFERKLANTSSIEILQNATVGIDAEHYLSRIYTFKKEQFLPGIGGVPSSLKEYIKSDLQVFKEFNIKPLFVISGLHIQLQDTSYQTNEYSPQELHHESSWANLGSKQPYTYNNTIESFRLFTDPLPLRPMVHDLIKYFIELNIDYIIAPYDASFQLSYLFQNEIVDTIYGSTDLLLTKIDKFILGMEFQSKDFRFIDKSKVLTELGLTERQFLDLSLMVGCNIQPTTFPNFPPLPKPNPVQPYPQLSYFKLGLDIVFQYNQFSGKTGDLHGYIAGLNDPKLLELYYKGHAAIKYVPVLNKEGLVALYNVEMAKVGIQSNVDFLLEEEAEATTSETISTSKQSSKAPSSSSTEESRVVKVPNDIHEIISQRLPPELYFYQSVGLMPIAILEAITKGRLDVRPPLEAGISESYRRLISLRFYVDLLDKQVNLLTQLLARYYQVKKINVKYWYKDAITEVNNRMTPTVSKRLSKFFIYGPESGETFNLAKFLGNLPLNGTNAYATEQTITSREDVVSTVFLRTLILFNAIDEKTQDLTLVGKILKRVAAEVENVLSDELQQLTLLLLLINSKSLILTNPNPEYSSVPASSKLNSEGADLTPREFSYVALISRVFSLHRFNVSPINYQGPISRNLLNFRSHVLFIAGHVINTIQCLLIDIIVQSKQNVIKATYDGKGDWYSLVNQLPFYKDINNTLLGVVAEIYFEVAAKLTKGGMKLEDAKTRAKDHLVNGVYQVKSLTFNINVHGMNSISASQLLDDFNSGVSFWKKFVQLAKIAHEEDSSIVDADYLKSITDADLWMDELI